MYFDPIEFGTRLRELRRSRGLTQSQLAEKLGIEKLHISRMENGVRVCSIDLLVEIAYQLDTSADYLLTGRQPQSDLIRKVLMTVIEMLIKLVKEI